MRLFLILVISLLLTDLSATTYYVSPTGDNNNDGLSTSSPFKTLFKVTNLNLAPGDIVLFEGGATFNGHLEITKSGTANAPITFSSYNTGKAKFISDDNECIHGKDISNVIISNLILEGDYVALADGCNNTSSINGVGITVKATSNDCDNILIDGIESSNFKWAGIRFHGTTNHIVKNSEIKNSVTHNNGYKGIEITGSGSNYNQNININHCTSHSNEGWTAVPAGSGIHGSRVAGLIVEYCIAYNNGGNNYVGQNQCGETPPVNGGGGGGIWVSNCSDVVFQYNESYQNKAGGVTDAHGFDIDGNVDGALVQYNYSHDNQGAGYLIFQYTAASTKNVTIRYNISVNDASKEAQGAIHIHRSSSAGAATENIFIYNNTVYNIHDVGMVHLNGGIDGNITNAVIINNLFIQLSGYQHEIHAFNGASPTAYNNHLHHPDPLKDEGNPMVTDIGFSGTIGDPDNMANLLTAYHPISGSPLIDKGVDLINENISGLTNTGIQDFSGVVIPQSESYDIGAIEFNGSCNDEQLLTSNLFNNPNPSAIPDWHSFAGTGASMSSSVDNSGIAHLDITDGGTYDYSLQLWQDNIAIESGQVYQINFNAKADASRSITLIIRPTSTADFYLKHTFDISPNFETYSLSYTSPITLSSARLSILAGGSDVDIEIDEISLIKDCDGLVNPCVDFHSILLDSDVASDSYKANQEINSNSQIQNSKSVMMGAGKCINLLESFEVKAGGILECQIVNCK